MGHLIGSELKLVVGERDAGTVSYTCADWPGFQLSGLSPSLRLDGVVLTPRECRALPGAECDSTDLTYEFSGGVRLTIRAQRWHNLGILLRPTLLVAAEGNVVLNDVRLLDTMTDSTCVTFGGDPSKVRFVEQHGSYGGSVRRLVEPLSEQPRQSRSEPDDATEYVHGMSDLVWVAHDRQAGMGLLVGFMTSERWLGRVELESTPDGRARRWHVGFDGADVLLKPGREIPLEDVLLLAGNDPWKLLEDYADAVRALHQPVFPKTPPVSWCSWYPYRLGVTEERVLENARLAAERLKPLGLSTMQVDLGWEQGNLPCAFEENERFPHGLKWLADQLGRLGFDLGVWKAPYTISEFDPLAREHPEYLIQGEDGTPAPYWEWFWEPHGKVFILDLTHPGAQSWLREKMTSLAERGVRYLKTDFIGSESHALARKRHDPEVAAGGALEAARIGAKIIREALPEALVLNCGGPEMPGTGHWPLLYSCSDTGNTGFIGHAAQQVNHEALACHLWKNRRWGILQPSCLCVGGPGTLEDARLRATIAFMSGGQIDIGDTLTTLPEDRWAVLMATLPPLGLTARPIDLFEPLTTLPFDYESTCKGESAVDEHVEELPPGSVWHVRVAGGWDEWDLVGVFNYAAGSSAEKPAISRFAIPFDRLGIPKTDARWGYEFWSGQFLGTLPGKRVNAGGYVHPGDYQDLSTGDAPGVLDISFFGPGVRLLCLRTVRSHPWVVGATFHQSCGTELQDVVWDQQSGVLRGEVHRPRGATGTVAISTGGMVPRSVEVDGRDVPARTGSNGALLLPITVNETPARWSVRFQ